MNTGTTERIAAVESSRFSPGVILVAEDDPVFRHILQHWLESCDYQVLVANDGLEAWEILQRPDAPQLLILDWLMPGIDGLELCRRLREKQQASYPYVLLVTSRDDKQDVIRGLEAGADDYLTKPFDTGELLARLRVGERILKLQQQLIEAREALRFQATHDALTSIWNRAATLDLLHSELQRAVRSQTSTGLLMVDLDHFKQINDTYGHLAGDMVLQEVARRIALSIRSYDLLGRYGGEEFLVVLSDCKIEDLAASAERVRHAVAESPVRLVENDISATVSIGAGVAAPGLTAEEQLLARADTALYRAKNAGRNRVELTEGAETETR